MKNAFTVLCVLTLAAGCTWVKPSAKSHEVVLATQDQVVNCVKKGVTRSKTLSKVTVVPRSQEKMFNELVLLAKNEAVILGGDTVVAEGTISEGSQSFGVYRCR